MHLLNRFYGKNSGKVLETSGKFVIPKMWEPWFSLLFPNSASRFKSTVLLNPCKEMCNHLIAMCKVPRAYPRFTQQKESVGSSGAIMYLDS